MIKVTVVYPNTSGSYFDIGYYCDTHIPLVRRLLGPALEGVAVEHGIGGATPGSPAPYLAIGQLQFDSVEAFQSAFWAARAGNHERCSQLHQYPARPPNQRSKVVARRAKRLHFART
jgi:uncharacterized protein (TIGR02118 family)